MIVKDEARVITRCLSSVVNLIDRYVIMDTGSRDGTQQIIEEFMRTHNKTGVILQEPWKNFGYNKTLCLHRAREFYKDTEYLFWLDADEQYLSLATSTPPTREEADALHAYLETNTDLSVFYLVTHYAGLQYDRWNIVRNNQKYEWKMPVQEYLVAEREDPYSERRRYSPIYLLSKHEGNSSGRDRSAWDIAQLEEFVKENPSEPRGTFYLAQSLKDAGRREAAVRVYEDRYKITEGYSEERYISAMALASLTGDSTWYHRAISVSPHRLEAYYELLQQRIKEAKWSHAYNFCKLAEEECLVPEYATKTFLFKTQSVYDYSFFLAASLACYYSGHYEEAYAYGKQLLKEKKFPEHMRGLLEKNMEYFQSKVKMDIVTAKVNPIFSVFPFCIAIDDFAENVDELRRWALEQPFQVSGNYPGTRTASYATEQHRSLFEKLTGKRITYWPTGYNGSFQIATENQLSWIHRDNTKYSAILYLTPNAPLDSGTLFFRHKDTGLLCARNKEDEDRLQKDTHKEDAWEEVYRVNNRYNRLVIFNGKINHISGKYFGKDRETGRLFQVFFFDAEEN